MPSLEWSQKRGRGSWKDFLGQKRKLEVYEGVPRPVKFLSSYLRQGWRFSEERKRRINEEYNSKILSNIVHSREREKCIKEIEGLIILKKL